MIVTGIECPGLQINNRYGRTGGGNRYSEELVECKCGWEGRRHTEGERRDIQFHVVMCSKATDPDD